MVGKLDDAVYDTGGFEALPLHEKSSNHQHECLYSKSAAPWTHINSKMGFWDI